MDKNALVFPGSFLATEEEFMPGSNAFGDDNGNVYSNTIGVSSLDSLRHEASVEKISREVKIVERGCIVLGVVAMVKSSAALIDLKEAELNGERRTVHNKNASIAVFNIQNSFAKSVDEFFRIGDLVRARVLDVTPYGVELETKAPDMGVIKAFGVRSRRPLVLVEGNLRDPFTGETETRKISTEYILR